MKTKLAGGLAAVLTFFFTASLPLFAATPSADEYYNLTTPKISTTDTTYSGGAVSLDMWTDITPYTLSGSDSIVLSYP